MHLLLGAARRLPRGRRELSAGFGGDDDVRPSIGRIGSPTTRPRACRSSTRPRPDSGPDGETRRARAATDGCRPRRGASTEYERARSPCWARAALPAASESAFARASRKLRSSVKADSRSAAESRRWRPRTSPWRDASNDAMDESQSLTFSTVLVFNGRRHEGVPHVSTLPRRQGSHRHRIGRGLGLAYAPELARQGAAVVVNDVDAQTAAEAVASIEADGGTRRRGRRPGRVHRDREAARAAAVENFGRLDILVTNAGVLRDTVLWKMSDDDFDTVINVHLRGTFTCVREAVDLHARERDRRPHHLHRLADRSARQLRPDQLRRRQGRDRRHGAHLGAGAQARRHHRQRRHPGGRDRHDRDRAVLRRGRRGRRARRGHAGLLPPRPRLRHVRRRRRARSPTSPRMPRPASPVRRSASAATGFSCGSHPEAVVTAYREGGWAYEALVADFAAVFGDKLQTRRRGVPAAARGPAAPGARRRSSQASADMATHATNPRSTPRRDRRDRHARPHRGRRPRPRVAAADLVEAARQVLQRRRTATRPGQRSPTYYRERQDGRGRLHRRRRRRSSAHPALSSAEIAEGAARNNDVLIPFGIGRPAPGADAVDPRAERLVERPRRPRVQVPPDRAGLRPVRRAASTRSTKRCRSWACRPLFHTGQTGIGAGLPGGYGLKLGLSNPILLDPVAADFPDLQIIMAHPSVPWQDEALSVATHKHNMWIDLSGWIPEVLPGVAGARRQLGPARQGPVRHPTSRCSPRDRWIGDVAQTCRSSPRSCPGSSRTTPPDCSGWAADMP